MKWVKVILILVMIPACAFASPNTDLLPYFGRYELTTESRQSLLANGHKPKDLENFSPLYVLAGVNGIDVETHYYPNAPLSRANSGAHVFENTKRDLRLVFQAPAGASNEQAIGVSVTFGRFQGNYRRIAPSSPEPAETNDMNTPPLNQAKTMIRNGTYKNIHSLLVIKDGRTVFEEYFNGSDEAHQHQIRSAGKSITAILIGIAIDQGYLTGVGQNLTPFYPEYQPSSGWPQGLDKVDIKSLLTMTSGFDCNDLQSPYYKCEMEMFKSNDWIEYALTRPITRPPNQHYAYNSSSLMLLNGAIRVPAQRSVPRFADQYLFKPLGISGNYWRYSPKRRAFMGGSARMTARNMAKIGLLYLNKGQWNGRQIVSASWVDESTRQHVIADDHFGYGYLWWRGETFVNGRHIRTVFASGNGGQRIFIFPALNAVVVFTAGNYNASASQEFDILERHIIPALMPESSPPQNDSTPVPLCEKFTGTYRFENVTLFVTCEKSEVHVQRKDRDKAALTQITPTLFHYLDTDRSAYFKFVPNNQGVFDTMEYYRRFVKIVFTRMETE
jgi:CubicO group peptidase (beta-lactamase class C family)